MDNKILNELKFTQELINQGLTYLKTYTWQILAASVLLAIGYWVGGKAQKIVIKIGQKRKMDPTLLGFLASLARIILLIFATLVALTKLGITIAPLIAALGAGIFGATLAIQAPVANYAAGLAIIIMRPFKLGDNITIQGRYGEVEEITLGVTYLKTEDGERIQIPNKFIVGEIMHNSHGNRLVDTIVGISYSNDPQKAIAIIKTELEKSDFVGKEGYFKVGILEFGDSSVNLSYRYKVPGQKFFEAQFQVNSAIFTAFKTNAIEIPFPQSVVTLQKN
jgi:small conductance mechanosensitive channel